MRAFTTLTTLVSMMFTLLTFLSLTSAVPQHFHFHLHRYKSPASSPSALPGSGVIVNPPIGNGTDRSLYIFSRRARHLTGSQGLAEASALGSGAGGASASAAAGPPSENAGSSSFQSQSPPSSTSSVFQGTVYIPNPHQRVHGIEGTATHGGYSPLQYSYHPTPSASPHISNTPTVVVGSAQDGQPIAFTSKGSNARDVSGAFHPSSSRGSAFSAVESSNPIPNASGKPKFSDFEPVGPNNASQPLEKLASSSSGPVLIPRQTIKYASEASINVPSIAADKFHGTSSNDPTTKYVQVQNAPLPKLSDDLLKVGVDGALSTQYGLDPDTGVLLVDETTKDLIADLKRKPHLSRDGGKGGYLNGQKLFIFCDTGSYTGDGDFLGFVSSSVAIDKGMNAANGQPLTLEDGIGQWGDDAGRMRGFSPLTSGEQSYNLVMQGQGQRYAVWPESSLLPLNQTAALLYAPIVYDNVDMKTKKAVFTYTGTTLLVVTAHEKGGPRAERVIDKLFKQEEVEWGTIGGLRSYGPSGVGGNDGRVYIFGNTPKGLLLARVDVANIAKRHSYEYWTGGAWSPGMQAPDSPAHFVKGAFMDGDIFYSPAHLTFIFVFLNPFADNTFYFSYLEADHAILPPSVPGADPNSDYAENLVKFGWSDPQVLYKATAGPTGMYIYAGGVHQGYFDDDDITNGGKKMLLSWTAPTGKNPASDPSEYSIMTAEVEFA